MRGTERGSPKRRGCELRGRNTGPLSSTRSPSFCQRRLIIAAQLCKVVEISVELDDGVNSQLKDNRWLFLPMLCNIKLYGEGPQLKWLQILRSWRKRWKARDLGDVTFRLPHERVLLKELDLHSPAEGMMVSVEFPPCWNRIWINF